MRIFLLLLCVLSIGCTSRHLSRRTTNQAATISELYEQQVLNNLARFAANPHSTPHFATPSTATSRTTDTANLDGTPFRDFDDIVGLDAGRQDQLAWTMAPITDARRLRLMRCAYQRAVGFGGDGCTDCCDLRKEFLGKSDSTIPIFGKDGKVALNPETGLPYEGSVVPVMKAEINKEEMTPTGKMVCVFEPMVTDPEKLGWGKEIVRRQVVGNDGRPSKADPVYVLEERHGRKKEIVLPNFDCFNSCEVGACWFHRCRKCDVPRDCCNLVGIHCDTAIWVPRSGQEQFGRLVLEILEYATGELPKAASTPKKNVVLFLDKGGIPTTPLGASQIVQAELKLEDKNSAAIAGADAFAVELDASDVAAVLSRTGGKIVANSPGYLSDILENLRGTADDQETVPFLVDGKFEMPSLPPIPKYKLKSRKELFSEAAEAASKVQGTTQERGGEKSRSGLNLTELEAVQNALFGGDE